MTIFISIASYCDKLLPVTVEQAMDNAYRPDDLRFGIVEQSVPIYAETMSEAVRKQMRLITVDPFYSRGVCWARALAMTLYSDEDWFMQIDAHTIFDKGWDMQLISLWAECAKQSPKAYIGSYPHAFEIKDGEYVKQRYTENIIASAVAKDVAFPEDMISLLFTPTYVDETKPIRGFHTAAGCVFAPGSFVYEVPYDPYMYFYGEEALWALRAYTHGWDLFHVPKLPVYHYYDTGEEMEVKRIRHWHDEHDTVRTQRWWELQGRASQRMIGIVDGKNYGVYGLGNVRTVEEYAEFSGLDFKNRRIEPKAYVGPWSKSNA